MRERAVLPHLTLFQAVVSYDRKSHYFFMNCNLKEGLTLGMQVQPDLKGAFIYHGSKPIRMQYPNSSY